MFGSGARIGTAVRITRRVRLPTRPDPQLGRTDRYEVLHGTVISRASARHFATTFRRTISTTASSASASRVIRNQFSHALPHANPPVYGQIVRLQHCVLPVTAGWSANPNTFRIPGENR